MRIPSIELSLIASINEGDEEEETENEDTPLMNRDDPVPMPPATHKNNRTWPHIDYRDMSGIRDYNNNRIML